MDSATARHRPTDLAGHRHPADTLADAFVTNSQPSGDFGSQETVIRRIHRAGQDLRPVPLRLGKLPLLGKLDVTGSAWMV